MKDDATLKTAIEAELAWDPAVTAPHLGVTVHDGVVTLAGAVGSASERRAAEEAARRVAAVRALAVELRIEPPGPAARSDADLAAAARSALDCDGVVPAGDVQVTVDAARVELDGEVEREEQRIAAERTLRGLPGVAAVVNRLRLASTVDVAGIERQVAAVLGAVPDGGLPPVAVEVDGGRVRLSGHVRSWDERDGIARVARAAPGVDEVVNDLVVSG